MLTVFARVAAQELVEPRALLEAEEAVDAVEALERLVLERLEVVQRVLRAHAGLLAVGAPRALRDLRELQAEHALHAHSVRLRDLREVRPAVPDDLHDVGPPEEGEQGQQEGVPAVGEREDVEQEDVGRGRVADGDDAQRAARHAEFATLAVEDDGVMAGQLLGCERGREVGRTKDKPRLRILRNPT